ncbi:hypothetical protein CU102_23975 [Phyllobacterium brassicacearum]|uniref:Uncharacterized protein n=1 Tax=Phyllobacterium brassicacearum TaxID=314235 RepID=A0A2P7BA38_9HYPH|nr:hypothetical protein [Phyllobacterium brassicacearum]PSH63327.1 hypothetical protein CU102_23975 [Phyllobacterium brassicacearum]TDQ18175.1 hypothetical protein DEV91_12538 [Phyllobacterium brassicacearum]
MIRYLISLGGLKASLLIALALATVIGSLIFAANYLTDSIDADIAARRAQQEEEKAAAEKVKKIMDYDPSKARLVAP